MKCSVRRRYILLITEVCKLGSTRLTAPFPSANVQFTDITRLAKVLKIIGFPLFKSPGCHIFPLHPFLGFREKKSIYTGSICTGSDAIIRFSLIKQNWISDKNQSKDKDVLLLLLTNICSAEWGNC